MRLLQGRGCQVITAITHVITIITYGFSTFGVRPVHFPGTPPQLVFIVINAWLITVISAWLITVISACVYCDSRSSEGRLPTPTPLKAKAGPLSPRRTHWPQTPRIREMTHGRSQNIQNRCVRVSSSHTAAIDNKKESGLTLYTQPSQAFHTHPPKRAPTLQPPNCPTPNDSEQERCACVYVNLLGSFTWQRMLGKEGHPK